MTTPSALATARAYHDAWTTGDIDHAASLLAGDLAVEVPLNDYPTKTSFTAAIARFGALVRRVDLLSQIGAEHEAMILYDLRSPEAVANASQRRWTYGLETTT